ncbi:hypothetical protein [Streptomyces sp. NPDC048481]|uniref:hypothetical protein n=1 Tax=Streptomyces sp. NPDC048481 TaxID=3365557 RepID=UPI003710DB8A
MDSKAIIRDLLVEGLDDWVPVDRLIWLAREESEQSGGDFRFLAIELLTELMRDGLMEIGELGDTGLEPWSGGAEAVLARLVTALDQVGWMPAGGVCWLASTSQGDRMASE